MTRIRGNRLRIGSIFLVAAFGITFPFSTLALSPYFKNPFHELRKSFNTKTLNRAFLSVHHEEKKTKSWSKSTTTPAATSDSSIQNIMAKHQVFFCDNETFIEKSVLGHGTEGKVTKVQRQSDQKYYAKKKSWEISTPSFYNEIQSLLRIRELDVGPKIICVDRKLTGFVMEFNLGMPLGFSVPRWYQQNQSVEFQLVSIAQKMTEVYLRLHNEGLVHLDGHLNNWLFQEHGETLQLIDFGHSRDLHHLKSSTLDIPDVRHNPYGYCELTDVYITGKAWNSLLIALNLISQKYGKGPSQRFCKEWVNLNRKMLSIKKSDRPSFKSIQKTLQNISGRFVNNK